MELDKIISAWEACIEGECDVCLYSDYRHDGCMLLLKKYTINLLKELLKAQEPVKPVVDIDTWKCGNCGHTLEHQELLGDNVLFHEQYNYCPECGKAVKWDG